MKDWLVKTLRFAITFGIRLKIRFQEGRIFYESARL